MLGLLAGGGGSLRLSLLPSSTPLTDLDAAASRPRAPVVFPGNIASIAATGSRVLVISDGGDPSGSAVFRAFDLGTEAPVATSGISVAGEGAITGVDVATETDRAYFVAMRPGEIALHAYGNLTSTPTALRSISFRSLPRITGIETVRDGRVAVAASESRVAVVWSTAKILNDGEPTGGYAIFACTR